MESQNAIIFDLVSVQKKLDAAENLMKKQIGEVQNAGTDMKGRWEGLKTQVNKIRQKIIHNDAFIRENHLKQERTQAKINKTKEEQEKYQKEIDELRAEIDSCQKINEQILKRIKEYQMYRDFFMKVCEKEPKFKTIKEIIDRYECLKQTLDELSSQQTESLTAEYEVRRKICKKTERDRQAMVSLEAQLANVRSRAIVAKDKVTKWETILSQLQAIATEKNLELEQIRNSSWNIYKNLCKVKNIPIRLNRSDVEDQLAFITQKMIENKKVLALVKEHLRKINQAEIVNITTKSVKI